MEISRFMNSKDVAEHFREVGFEPNAAEAAYLVEICESATLEEKIEAWQEIIDTMPDCPMGWNHIVKKRHSAHDFLRDYIDLQRHMLDAFSESDGGVYLVHKVRWAKKPDWLSPENNNLWTEEWPKPFSTLAGCIARLKAELDGGENEYDRYRIVKVKVDFNGELYQYLQNEILLDGQFRPMDVWVGGLCERDWELGAALACSFYKMPVPFKCGDIVIDRTDPSPHPFAFDKLKFWSTPELAEHDCELPPADEAEMLDKRVAHSDERGGWDNSHMVACGFELGSDYDGGPLNDPCDLCYDVFGACENYLNLERYTEPLEGNRRVLGIASSYMKHEIDVECATNFTRLVSIECQAERLRRSYDTEYTPEARRLYQGTENRPERRDARLR